MRYGHFLVFNLKMSVVKAPLTFLLIVWFSLKQKTNLRWLSSKTYNLIPNSKTSAVFVRDYTCQYMQYARIISIQFILQVDS